MVQSGHALLEMASHAEIEGVPNLVIIGLPGEPALRRALSKLQSNGIEHYSWSEPDDAMGFTSIATVPLSRLEKAPLSNYRVWRMIPGSSVGGATCALGCGEVGGSSPSPVTSSGPRSSVGRANDSNSFQVVGSNPTEVTSIEGGAVCP